MSSASAACTDLFRRVLLIRHGLHRGKHPPLPTQRRKALVMLCSCHHMACLGGRVYISTQDKSHQDNFGRRAVWDAMPRGSRQKRGGERKAPSPELNAGRLLMICSCCVWLTELRIQPQHSSSCCLTRQGILVNSCSCMSLDRRAPVCT